MFGIRTWLSLGFVGIVAAALWGGYMFVNNMQQKIVDQAAVIGVQERALTETTDTLNELVVAIERQKILNIELNTNLQQAEEYADDLRGKLIEHDLETLAQQKPELIERIINNATNQVFDDLRRITSTQ